MERKNDKQIAETIAEKVKEKGGRVYYVGGCVRDEMLHLPNKDIDIEVHGISPQELERILQETGKPKLVGVSFGVYNLSGYTLDIAMPRSEHPTGKRHTDFEVSVDPFMGVEKAAYRRDFSINAIMKDVLSGEIIDPFHGKEDLEKRLIRHINPEAFADDALRVFRAAQFAARFRFDVDKETMHLMEQADVNVLSRERIYAELEKALLKGQQPDIFFQVLQKVRQMDCWFPELADKGCQTAELLDTASKYRDNVKDPRNFMMTAVCYPIYAESKSIASVNLFLKRINPDVSMKKYVVNMLQNTDRLMDAFQQKKEEKISNEIFDSSICKEDLTVFASVVAEEKREIKKWAEERLDRYNQILEHPEVQGKDLIAMGMRPSVLFGEILKKAHEQYLEGKSKNEILKDIKDNIIR